MSAGDEADVVKAVEVVAIIRPPLMNRGHYDQALRLLEETNPTDPVEAAFFTIHRARLAGLRGGTDVAVGMIRPLISSEDERIAREAVLVLSTIYNDGQLPSEAVDLLEAHWHLFSGSISRKLKTRFLSRLVQAHLELGNTEQAFGWARQVAESCEVAGEHVGGGVALRQMAVALASQGLLVTALEMCRGSLDLLEKSHRVREAAISRVQLASIEQGLGNLENARRELEISLEVFLSLGDRSNSTDCRKRLRAIKTAPN
jgi:tetratricopeptide (TPR) repeat protein